MGLQALLGLHQHAQFRLFGQKFVNRRDLILKLSNHQGGSPPRNALRNIYVRKYVVPNIHKFFAGKAQAFFNERGVRTQIDVARTQRAAVLAKKALGIDHLEGRHWEGEKIGLSRPDNYYIEQVAPPKGFWQERVERATQNRLDIRPFGIGYKKQFSCRTFFGQEGPGGFHRQVRRTQPGWRGFRP